MDAPRLTIEEQHLLHEGARLFNSGAFWESHEAWEAIWRARREAWRIYLQGLIQMAAGYHQLRRRIYHGTVKHLRNARQKLRQLPRDFLGIDNEALMHGMQQTLDEVQRRGRSGIDMVPWQEFPRIRFLTTDNEADLNNSSDNGGKHGK